MVGMLPVPGGNPEDYAAMYAKQNGISLDEARNQLRARYGDPQPRGMSMNEGLLGLQFRSSGTSLDNVISLSTTSTSANNKTYKSYHEIKLDAENVYYSNTKYETTRSERKDIKKQTNNYVKQLETYQKEYIKAHKDDYKSASSRTERKSIKAQVYKDAEQYAINKFRQEYPDVDLSTVFYNARENLTGHALFSHPNLKPYN